MKSTCEALRRDGTRCPNQWKHAFHTGVSRYWPEHLPHPRQRTVNLCGQHKNALHKGIMVVNLVADPGHRDAFISAGRDGNYSYASSEVTS